MPNLGSRGQGSTNTALQVHRLTVENVETIARGGVRGSAFADDEFDNAILVEVSCDDILSGVDTDLISIGLIFQDK